MKTLIVLGIVPLRELKERSNVLKYLNSLIPLGIVPVRELKERSNSFKYFNSLNGTIPSTMSVFISLRTVFFQNNYLTMGTATTVPTSTFSSYTLSNTMNLSSNCLAFHTDSPYRHVTATHCRPTSKYRFK